MNRFKSDYRGITSAGSIMALRQESLDFARSYGFAAVYFVSPIAIDSREGRVLTNIGFDKLWARSYRHYLHRIDPLPELALTRVTPFHWGDVADLRDLNAEERRYMAILERRGMGDGLAVPVFGPGARTGLAGLGLHPDLSSVTEEDEIELRIGMQLSFLRYCEIIAPQFHGGIQLSQREMDVLHWIAKGKSNAAIATILDIAQGTVDTYVRRVFKKFGVVDRIGAVRAAVRHGHIVTGSYRTSSETAAD